MKNYIMFLIVSFILVSCTKGRVNYETQYLQVENLTTHNVSLIIFNKYDLYDKKDTTPIMVYNIPSNFSGVVDTIIIEFRDGEDDYCRTIYKEEGNNCENVSINSWGAWTSNQFVFNAELMTEINDYTTTSFADCDTSGLIKACVIISYSRDFNTLNNKRADITEKTTYYITEQQYELADSI